MEEQQSGSRKWMEDAQEALDRAGDALKGAWEGTRESRLAALESAKTAATQLGEAIEKGVSKAKERWEGTSESDGGEGVVGEEE